MTKGGKRVGAGRKPNGYVTKPVTFKVKEDHIEAVRQLVKLYIQFKKHSGEY